MPKNYANRVWMTTATAGTGTITLGSAVAGYFTFAEGGIANADTVSYVIIDGNDFEVGIGTYTSSGTTMSRDTVIASKIGGVAGTTKITLSGTAEVFLSPNEADLAFTDIANVFTANQTLKSTGGGSTDGPIITLFHDSPSPANGDDLGRIDFRGRDSLNNETLYGSILGEVRNTGDGSERGRVSLYATGAGTEAFMWFSVDGLYWAELGVTDNSASVAPILYLSRYSASPAVSDILATIDFYGSTTTGGIEYARIVAGIVDPTHATATGDLTFYTADGGALTERMNFADAGVTEITYIDASASLGPVLQLTRDSASPAVSDILGHISFFGRDSAANLHQYAAIYAAIASATDGAEAGALYISPASTTGSGQLAVSYGTIDFWNTTTYSLLSLSRYQNAVDGDIAGLLQFAGQSDTGTYRQWGQILSYVDESANAAEDTSLGFKLYTAGVQTEAMRLYGDGRLKLYSANAGAGEGPVLELNRNSASPATGDLLGQLKFYGRNYAGTERQGFRVTGIHGYSDATYEEWYIRFSGYQFDSGVTNATFDLFEIESNGSVLVLPGPYGAPQLAILTENTGTTGGRLSFQRWVGTGVGGAVANGDELGNIWWSGFDGTTFFLGTARIESDVDGTPGANDQPTRLTFWTTPDGTVGPLERMRISADGTVRLYSTDAGSGIGPTLDLYRDSSSPAASDLLGRITFNGEDSGGNKTEYGTIYVRLDDPTNGSEDATLVLAVPRAGSGTGGLGLGGDSLDLYQGVTYPKFLLSRYQNLADNDIIGELRFAGYSDTGVYRIYSSILGYAADSGNTSEDAYIDVQLARAGTTATRQRFAEDGQILTFSNAGANKGHVPATHWVMLTADYTLSNSGSEQKFFNTTTNGALTIPDGVYEFEAFLYLTTMSATSGNLAFDPVGAGTATTDRWGYIANGIDNSTPLNAGTRTGSASVTQQSVASIVTAGTGTGMVVHVTGMFRVTAGGTIIPSITLVTANAAVAKAGSWFKCAKIGEQTETYVGAWT